MLCGINMHPWSFLLKHDNSSHPTLEHDGLESDVIVENNSLNCGRSGRDVSSESNRDNPSDKILMELKTPSIVFRYAFSE